MTQWIWFNGEIMPMSEAHVGVEDRGFQFADGVYEVMHVYNGRVFALKEHFQRLDNSAKGIELDFCTKSYGKGGLAGEIDRLIAKSGVKEGMVYLQVTRGVAARDHVFPKCPPTVLFYVRELSVEDEAGKTPGIKLLEVEDERWKRCWIKSIALLPNVLAKNKALAAGADEAVFVDNGIVTECSTRNIFGVIGGKLVTHPAGAKVLPGVTRQVVIGLAKDLGIGVEERGWTVQEALSAEEVFVTGTIREVLWVAWWNKKRIASKCGGVAMKLHRALREKVRRETL